MKKWYVIGIGLFLFFLSACSSKQLTVEFEKDIYFKQQEPSDFSIVVRDDSGPVQHLDIEATFAMVDMDHGTEEAIFTEVGEGIYSSSIKLPMAGKWEIVFTIVKDGKEFEVVKEYEVKEPAGVALIEGKWITDDDLVFYRFINDLHIAINREKDRAQFSGEKLEERLSYWDTQQKEIQDQNQLLTQIIRLRSMALLGKEKGFNAPDDEIKSELSQVRKQYEEVEVAATMIRQFGEKKFWETQKKQYELIILSQKVQNDLIHHVKKENPDVNQQEILYLAQKKYEELLVSQVNSLDIDIM